MSISLVGLTPVELGLPVLRLLVPIERRRCSKARRSTGPPFGRQCCFWSSVSHGCESHLVRTMRCSDSCSYVSDVLLNGAVDFSRTHLVSDAFLRMRELRLNTAYVRHITPPSRDIVSRIQAAVCATPYIIQGSQIWPKQRFLRSCIFRPRRV